MARRGAKQLAGAPKGALWDGCITNHALHLLYADMADGLVLLPHCQHALMLGWLDKGLKHRHGATGVLDNRVLMARRTRTGTAPAPAGRITAWIQGAGAAGQLADEAAVWLAQPSIDDLPV